MQLFNFHRSTSGCVILNTFLIFLYGIILASKLKGKHVFIEKLYMNDVTTIGDVLLMKMELQCQEKILWKAFTFLTYLQCILIVF